MRLSDYFHFSVPVFSRHKSRTLLIISAISIGVTAVILLTSMSEGVRRFIENEFSALGSQLLIVLPGKTETQGGAPPIYGTTPRDLTIDDAQALQRIANVEAIAPVIAGTAMIKYQHLAREVITIGSSNAIFPIRNLHLSHGRNFSSDRLDEARTEIIIGQKLKRELFGNQRAIGQWIHIDDYRFRVIGVLEERGESLGLDFRDMAIIPVRSAEMVFDSPALFRILIQLKHMSEESATKQSIRTIIANRHEGEDDISFISQDAMLSAFDAILSMVTLIIGLIASISLVVAGVLIMNVTFISVVQRQKEIGLLKALGASARQVKFLFVSEAMMLSLVGALMGAILAALCINVSAWIWPYFPVAFSWIAFLLAVFIAISFSLLFSWHPASRAAAYDPVKAMRGMF